MKRIMYVLQDEDDRFYWESDSVSSMHGLTKNFEHAYLFKSKQGAEQRKKLPCYSKCTIKEVELKLVNQ